VHHLQDPLAETIEEVLSEHWAHTFDSTFEKLLAEMKDKMPSILKKTEDKLLIRGGVCHHHQPENSSTAETYRTPAAGHGIPSHAAVDTAQLANLGTLFTPIGLDSHATSVDTYNINSQNNSIFDPGHLPAVQNGYLEHGTMNPSSLGTINFPGGVDYNDANWDDPFGAWMPQPQGPFADLEGRRDNV